MEKSSSNLLEAFKQSELLAKQESCKRASIFTAVFMMAGGAMDALIYPESLTEFLIIRLGTSALLLILGYLVSRMLSDLTTRVTTHLMIMLPMLAISSMIMMTEGGESPYYGGLNLILMGSTLLLRCTLLDSILSGIFCLLFYSAAMVGHNTEWQGAFIPSYFIFVTGFMTSVVSYFVHAGRFREFCLNREVENSRAKLEESYSQLKAMDATKSRFFANISHELRTPLTLILGPAEDLRATAIKSEDKSILENLDTIEDNAFRLLRLINEILDLVKLDSNESPPRPETINVTDFISGLTSNLRPTAALKNIEVSYHSDTEEQKLVWLDRDRLDKIVLNLAVNAVKFTQPGGTIDLGASTKNGNLTLSVIDSGEGMSKEELDNIFVRFWQADMSAKRKHRGAGIGLALVRSLTESMHGNITVESELGKGSSFTVVIPAPKPEESTALVVDAGPYDVIERFNERARMTGATRPKEGLVQKREELVQNQTSEENFSTGTKKRVLVADDEDAMRYFIVRQLSEYEVISACDGDEAWEIIQNESLDIIVLDLMMPGKDGVELTSLIRAHPEYTRIPIVLITAQASDASRLKALEEGANDFIAKPFSSVELRARLRNLLASSEFEAGLAESNADLELAYGKLKEKEAVLVQTERLSSLGRMSAGIVHEVNNPLNYTKTALHALKTFDRQLPEDEREDFLDVLGDVQEGVDRVINIVSDLRAFTRGDDITLTSVILRDAVENARRLASQTLREVTMKVDIDEDLKLEGHEGQLCQLFINLFQNSVRAIQVSETPLAEGIISVCADQNEEGETTVSVRDNGSGISEKNIKHMFEPFFTKNDVGEGMGLGLSICHRIIQQHNASVRVTSEFGEFTEIIILFPKS